MPPKKKSRVPITTTDSSDAPAPSTPGPNPPSVPTSTTHLVTEPVLSDGWTDEQEITLFKAIAVYRWKPAGMHKHFRMLSITQLMRNHGVFDAHTSPPGIWAKLHTLYNLEGLDEREDLPDDEADGVSPGFTDFRLPEEEFGEMMSARRLNPEGTASPSHGASVRRKRFSELVKSAKGGGKAAAKEGSLEGGEAEGGSEDESVARSSPMSQRSVPRKRAAGLGAASRLSAIRGMPATPRGGARAGARGGAAASTKKTPVGSAKRKVEVQQASSEEEGNSSESEDEEEDSEKEGSGSEGLSGSTQEEDGEEDGGSGDEEGEEEEDGDEEGGGEEDEEEEEEEGREEEGDGPPKVSTARGGGRRSGRGGLSAAGKVKTPAKRGGRITVDSSVRRSARKK